MNKKIQISFVYAYLFLRSLPVGVLLPTIRTLTNLLNLPHESLVQTRITHSLNVFTHNDRLAEMHIKVETNLRGAHVETTLVYEGMSAGEELGRYVALAGVGKGRCAIATD